MPNTPKPIGPSDSLKNYLSETLALRKLKTLGKKTIDGSTVGSHDELRIRNNREAKVRAIDNLFESMANLIYFFEFLNHNPELIDKFGDDLEDLLGLKGGGHRNPVGECFPRLLQSFLDIGSVGQDDDYRFNFRRRMLKVIQFLINQKAMLIVTNTRKEPRGYEDSQFRKMINNDLERAQVWMNYLDRLTGHETKKPSRVLAF